MYLYFVGHTFDFDLQSLQKDTIFSLLVQDLENIASGGGSERGSRSDMVDW